MKSFSIIFILSALNAVSSPTLAQAQDGISKGGIAAKEKGAYWNAIECLIASNGDIVTYAENLMKLQSNSETGASGWPYKNNTGKTGRCHSPNSIDAFSDGTCNPPETPYMIQTGYAIACLGRAYLATKDNRYLELAQKAADDSWDLGVDDGSCKGSQNYWFSYSKNDFGRFVRNTNTIMGIGLLWLYRATENPKYRNRVIAIAKSEKCEIAAGNYGYLGIADPQYKKAPTSESRRIENHIPHQVKFLDMTSSALGDKDSGEAAQQLLSAFLSCKESHCKPENCEAWAASFKCQQPQKLAHCMLPESPQFNTENCEKAKASTTTIRGVAKYLISSPSQ